ncbi:glycosyltransferase [Nocardioides litoris]|uniref:glycosyltransferase n=1 Tax=Nocardioides litoris TaxID=1926648 RepID=UPI00147682D8|nr:glycosyltransferase family A protein [Nocardioides litoris]
MSDDVAAVHVVVPAHDEALLLPVCLGALDAAVVHLRSARPDLAVRLTVVLDACSDDSAQVCAAHGVDVVVLGAGNVSLARAAGVDRARALAAAVGLAPERTWIAWTDADSVVPVGWLLDQVEVADGPTGADVVLGRVVPDPTAPPAVLDQWHAHHADGRVGVHGAHLGFRLSSYDAVGGLGALAEREDLDLVRRLLADGARYGAARTPVLTSSRLQGRTPGGFAGYLAGLATDGVDEPAG